MRTGDRSKSINEQPHWRAVSKGIGSVLMTLGIAVPGAIIARNMPYNRQGMATYLHHPRANERFILDALQRSISEKPHTLRCVDNVEANASANSRRQPTLAMVSHLELLNTAVLLPAITMLKEECDGVISYAESNKQTVTPEQVRSLNTATHEAEHLKHNDWDEARTECRAFQEVATLAIKLGATPAQAHQVQIADISIYFNMPAKYIDDRCHDGGPLDNDPMHPGIFPYKPDLSRNK